MSNSFILNMGHDVRPQRDQTGLACQIKKYLEEYQVKLNVKTIDRAVKLMTEVDEHRCRFHMETYITTVKGGTTRNKPTLTGSYASRVTKQGDCGTVACLAGWLSQCLWTKSVIENLEQYAYRLFIIDTRKSKQLDGYPWIVSARICRLLFDSDWARVAPTANHAIIRLMWLRQNGLEYCLGVLDKNRLTSEIWRVICEDLQITPKGTKIKRTTSKGTTSKGTTSKGTKIKRKTTRIIWS